MTVDEFRKMVQDWITTAEHPRYKRLYTDLVYQPMLEVMQYLRANGFKTYIVTGGGQDFVRQYSQRVYGVPPEQVVGTSADTAFGYDKSGKAVLTKTHKILYVDDKQGKPLGIHLMIGRPPVAAFGNSTGDQQMLEYTQAGEGARLMVLVHHDDAVREYSYGPASSVGTFSNALMAEAKKRGWVVISMKNDWKRILLPRVNGPRIRATQAFPTVDQQTCAITAVVSFDVFNEQKDRFRNIERRVVDRESPLADCSEACR